MKSLLLDEENSGILAKNLKTWYNGDTKVLEVIKMLKFILLLPIRIICLPIVVALKLVFWLCSGILCMTEWIFGLAAGLLALMGIYTLFFDSTSYGIGLLIAALIVSPFGIPMLALEVVMLVDTASEAIRGTIIESICLQNSS